MAVALYYVQSYMLCKIYAVFMHSLKCTVGCTGNLKGCKL